MNLQGAVLAAALASVVSVSLGGTETNVRPEVADETAESEWECSLSISTYLVQNGRDYANPILVADRDWLHLEARYNYEAIKTGSLWLGYNFSFGKKLAFEGTPDARRRVRRHHWNRTGLYDLDQLRANRVLHSRRVFLRCWKSFRKFLLLLVGA